MIHIIIAFELHWIEGQQRRLYLDSTEKYFDSLENEDSKNYIQYLLNKNLNVDISPINVLVEGDLNVLELYKQDALLKLTIEEKNALGI